MSRSGLLGGGLGFRVDPHLASMGLPDIWEFPKIRGTLFWVLITRIILFRVITTLGTLIFGNSRLGECLYVAGLD